MGLRTLQTPAYSNCLMLSPEGIAMCRTGKRRAEWYVDRGLARLVSRNPYTIQLLFQPQGLGKHNDPFYLEEKHNVCVVCGRTEELTKHHCVPRCFRRYFPEELKDNASHDVLLLCRYCHDSYEIHAHQLKMQYINWDEGFDDDKRARLRAYKSARTLLSHGNRIPVEKAVELMLRVEEFLGYGRSRDEDLERLVRDGPPEPDHKKLWEEAAKRIPDYEDFIEQWRLHFVKTMKPKYMPKHWKVVGRIHNN